MHRDGACSDSKAVWTDRASVGLEVVVGGGVDVGDADLLAADRHVRQRRRVQAALHVRQVREVLVEHLAEAAHMLSAITAVPRPREWKQFLSEENPELMYHMLMSYVARKEEELNAVSPDRKASLVPLPTDPTDSDQCREG